MPSAFQQQIQVLHVDNDPDFTDLTRTFLEHEDDRFAVETTTSAADGLEMINDSPPDCVLSDYNMPGMDGLEFLQAVREGYPDLPFILFIGRGSEEVASDAISVGATDYLQKQTGPEQYSVLINRIRNAVDQYWTEQRLRKTWKEYAAVFESAHNALLLVTVEDDGFRYQQCNPPAVELIGRNKAEIVGKTPIEALGPENGRKVVGAYRTCVERANPVEYTLTLDLPRGQAVRKCEVTPLTTNGETDQLVVEFRDITQQRQHQQEREAYRTVVNALTDAVYALDEEGRFTYVNDEFIELVGYERETILGNTPSLIKDREAVERGEDQLGRVLSTDGPDTVTFEVTIQPRDGDPIDCEDHLGVLPYEGDQFNGSVGILRNITPRKKREQGLERTNDLMSNMEQLANAGAWEYDPETESLTVTDGARRLHGLDSDENLTLEAALEAVHSDDRDRLRDRVEMCLETGESYEVEVRFTTPDNAQRWLTIEGERVSGSDASSVVRGYIRDTTEQHYQQDLKRFWTVFEAVPGLAERTRADSEPDPDYALQSGETIKRRLEYFIDTYQPITEILNRVSSRKEAEQAVCDFLTATRAYDVAWIAEYTPEMSELTPQFRSDPDGKIAEDWTPPSMDPAADQTLPRGAAETGTVQVVTKNQPVDKYEAWRAHTLEHGFSGCALVPLVYRDQTYGLLGVYTTRQSPFNTREQVLLQTVGNRLGRLIHEFVVEKQLHTDTVSELTFRSTDSHSLFVRTATDLGCTVEVTDSIPTSEEAFIHYVSISGASVDEFIEAVADNDVVRQVRSIRRSDDPPGGDVELKLSRHSIAGTLINLGAVVTTNRVTDGDAEVVCEVPVGEDISSLVARVTSSFSETTLVSKYEYDRSVESDRQTSAGLLADVFFEELTERQRQTLEASVYGGYFESPRRSTATEIADALSVTQPTVSRHLRDAQRKLFERMFKQF